MKDMKASLRDGVKPDITHVRTPLKVYIARACEYGSDKYERANYMRPPGDNSIRGHFERYREYLRSVQTHVDKTLDAMEKHEAMDPGLEDEAGMKAAAYALDTDDCEIGPSMLPHVAHAGAALMMAITQATQFGLLPEDPGQPWKQTDEQTPSKEKVKAFAQTKEPHSKRCPHNVLGGSPCINCEGGYARRVGCDS